MVSIRYIDERYIDECGRIGSKHKDARILYAAGTPEQFKEKLQSYRFNITIGTNAKRFRMLAATRKDPSLGLEHDLALLIASEGKITDLDISSVKNSEPASSSLISLTTKVHPEKGYTSIYAIHRDHNADIFEIFHNIDSYRRFYNKSEEEIKQILAESETGLFKVGALF